MCLQRTTMNDNCRVCHQCFPKELQKGSYQRISVKALASPHTYHKVFPQTVTELSEEDLQCPAKQHIPGFLCGQCVSILKSKTVQMKGRNGRKPIKRKWAGTPNKLPAKCTLANTPYNHLATSPSKLPSCMPSKVLSLSTPSKWSPVSKQSKRLPVFTPSKRPTVSTPSKRPVVSTPSKRPAVSTPAKRPTVSTPSKRPPVSTPSKWPQACTPSKKSIAGNPSKAHLSYTPVKRPPGYTSCQISPNRGCSLKRSPYKSSCRSLRFTRKDEDSCVLRDLSKISPRAVQSPTKKKASSDYGPGPGFTQDAAALIRKHQYQAAFRLLVKVSPPAKKAMMKVVGEEIRNEKRAIKGSKTSFNEELTLDSIKEFNWSKAIEEIDTVAPVTVSVVKDLFPAAKKMRGQRTLGSKKDKRAQTVEEAERILATRIGTVMSLVLFSNSPKKFKFIPSAVGVELWRQGTSQKAFVTLNQMGVTQSSSAARGHVDRLGKHHDTEIVEWKSIVQESGKKKKVVKLSLEKKLVGSSLAPNCGYGVCWDNVQVETHAKHQGIENQNSFLLWGMMFGINNRVPTLQLSRNDTISAVDVPISAFLPNVQEKQELREHLEHIVVQVLCRNLDCLIYIRFPKHRKHAHTHEMNSQSTVVNLGVKEANPSSTNGCIVIMAHLYRYVPLREDIVFYILCSGDGMSYERMIHAHLARANGRTHAHRLEGLVEAPQEFHKEILLLQDFMNLLFRGNSLAFRGSLAQLKSEFKHKNLQKEVKNNVAHVWDMLQFSTEAYVTLCAMKLRGMTSIEDLPDSFPAEGSVDEQKRWVTSLAAEVVDLCWSAPPDEDLAAIAVGIQDNQNMQLDEEIFPYCCKEGKDDGMVRCCSWLCDRVWHHLSCVNLEAVPQDDWYCSPECLASGAYIYCNCHKYTGGEMLECALGDDCKRHQWYHVQCVEVPEGVQATWFCSDDCSLGALEDDPVLNHSKALMWLGLNNIARREAVRDGNGPEMVAHWKLDLPKFWTLSHPKYFIIAHHFLANVGGVQPEYVRQDLVWNRVGNLKGNESGNVGLDLINEFLNNDFKEMLKHSHGRYTEKEVARCAQMSGGFGRQIDRLFTQAGLGQYDSRPNYHKADRYKEDIRVFCHDYAKDALFDYLPGRTPEGFENFVYNKEITAPLKMGQKIQELSQIMDSRKRVGRRRRAEDN